jgi:hypothetical protein
MLSTSTDPCLSLSCKVSIRDEGDLRNKKEMRKDQYAIDEALGSSKQLSAVFPSEPPEGIISIVVRVGECV